MPAKISAGTVHPLPADLKAELLAHPDVLESWESLTPLARNEWICWTTAVKTDATRAQHVARVSQDLRWGKRRPCCWIGCIHRTDKAISPSVRGILKLNPKT